MAKQIKNVQGNQLKRLNLLWTRTHPTRWHLRVQVPRWWKLDHWRSCPRQAQRVWNSEQLHRSINPSLSRSIPKKPSLNFWKRKTTSKSPATSQSKDSKSLVHGITGSKKSPWPNPITSWKAAKKSTILFDYLSVVYLRLLPNTSYEFKFKLGKQYLIDEKYPTVINKYGTQNNRIITYSERI